MIPCWKFGMLSSTQPGRKNGSLAVQPLASISRKISAAAVSIASEPPSVTAGGVNATSSSMSWTTTAPIP